MTNNKYSLRVFFLFIFFFPSAIFAWSWDDLWQTADQHGLQLLQAGQPKKARSTFKNKDWQAVAAYREGDYVYAFRYFNNINSSEAQYNAGNAAAFLKHYQEAITAYDKAISLNPHNTDAIVNRDIIKKLIEQQNMKESLLQKNMSDQFNRQHDHSALYSEQNSKPEKNPNQTNYPSKNPPSSPQNQSQKIQNQVSLSSHSLNENHAHLQALQAMQAQEKQNQLLRRLQDDPGGLLQQKFLRDYMKRHPEEDIADQGEN